jgi:hypothetical protein
MPYLLRIVIDAQVASPASCSDGHGWADKEPADRRPMRMTGYGR